MLPPVIAVIAAVGIRGANITNIATLGIAGRLRTLVSGRTPVSRRAPSSGVRPAGRISTSGVSGSGIHVTTAVVAAVGIGGANITNIATLGIAGRLRGEIHHVGKWTFDNIDRVMYLGVQQTRGCSELYILFRVLMSFPASVRMGVLGIQRTV
jgi:hypothetical protein